MDLNNSLEGQKNNEIIIAKTNIFKTRSLQFKY